MKEKRCIKCAQIGHRADACVASASSKKDDQAINALVSGMEGHHLDSEMESDVEYLFSIKHSASPLAMYKCTTNNVSGIALGDFGANRVYVSRKYAERANLKFVRPKSPKVVSVPSGHTMSILGYCTFDLTMGEWTGELNAAILDIEAEFDIVLGMQWFREWQPIIEWDTLSMFINMPDGAKLISHEKSDEL
jgi:hypothetical protein